MRDTIIEHMLAKPFRYSLFQAIYLIQLSQPDADRVGFHGKPSKEAVRIKNVASLLFPANHVHKIEESEDNDSTSYSIETSLLGLYGALSPLPTIYTSTIVGESEDGAEIRERLRNFLDMFNHRILSLYHRADEYRHVHRHYHCDDPDTFSEAVLASVGYADREMRESVGENMLTSLSRDRLLGFSTRSAAGLKKWLTQHFPDIPTDMAENVPQWVRLSRNELSCLGMHHSRLPGGEDDPESGCTLGEWMLDHETKFRVSAGPLKWDTFINFLPGGVDHLKMVDLVELFVPDWLDFDLQVKLIGSECSHLQCVLDGHTSQLGLTAGLFDKNGQDQDLSLILDVKGAA